MDRTDSLHILKHGDASIYAVVPCFSSHDAVFRAGFLCFVFPVSHDCCVALPHGATGLSVVCDCGISCSYSLFSI